MVGHQFAKTHSFALRRDDFLSPVCPRRTTLEMVGLRPQITGFPSSGACSRSRWRDGADSQRGLSRGIHGNAKCLYAHRQATRDGLLGTDAPTGTRGTLQPIDRLAQSDLGSLATQRRSKASLGLSHRPGVSSTRLLPQGVEEAGRPLATWKTFDLGVGVGFLPRRHLCSQAGRRDLFQGI